ncbi:MAG TPA: type I-C CRISPR-associated protein Cas7/Csd2 [Ruminococcaceae bacterium]|nr:type I-C CRISPR-associated protein Cas7/Csd2 [Oscillospiraceae bacterium]
MSKFENKVDFVVLVSVTNANSNGDPLNGNRPRTDYNGFGEISDVCIKRKIRNRMQDMGNEIFVKSDDRADDGCICLKDRAAGLSSIKSQDDFAKKACENWLDVRSFGQVFAFKGFNCSSVGVRGPVSIHQAISMDPVEIDSMQITKSVSGDRKKESERSSDTMGMKHFVRFGLYEIKGSINVQLADKTGFSAEDAQTIKECLKTLFVNDTSAARPDGSMEVVKLIWWEHNCKDGQYSSAKVHRSVKVKLHNDVAVPSCIDDYDISIENLDGLTPEVIDCV